MLVPIVTIAVFILLLVWGMPIGFVFFTAGMIGIALLRGWDAGLAMMGNSPYVESANYILVAIPLFILMGQLIFYSGLSTDLYNAGHKLLGRFLGGLAHATVVSCALFGACTGSSMAAVGTIGPIAVKEMEKFNYDSRLACGTIVCGGTLGILIPPSLAFIVYGYLCEVPIGQLFIAGIIPGILLSVTLMLTVYLMCLRNPALGPKGEAFSLGEMLKSLSGVWWSIAVFVVMLGGIYFGIFTPTEAGGIGSFVVFLILLIGRRMTWTVFADALRDTTRTTCMIFTIFIGAKVFNTFVALSGIPQGAVESVSALPFPPLVILAIILLAYIPLGCFIDSVPLFVLTLPIVDPMIKQLGFDQLWFGVLVVFVAQISLITPPVGMNVYVLSGATGKPVEEVFRGALPFLLTMVFTLLILFFFPFLSTYLPGLMR